MFRFDWPLNAPRISPPLIKAAFDYDPPSLVQGFSTMMISDFDDNGIRKAKSESYGINGRLPVFAQLSNPSNAM